MSEDRLTIIGKGIATARAAMYSDRCTIRRVSKMKGADMGNVNTETVLASDVPCRIRPASATEREIAAATEATVVYAVRMPAWQSSERVTIDSQCEIELAFRDGAASPSDRLRVVAPLNNQGTAVDFLVTQQG